MADRLIDIENVHAGSGNDIVIGNGAANTLNGQAGSDRLYGAGATISSSVVLVKIASGASRTRHLQHSKRHRPHHHQRFSDGEDRIQLGAGSSELMLKTRGDDVLICEDQISRPSSKR